MDLATQPSMKLRPRRAPTIADPICVTMKDAEHLSGLGHTKLAELVKNGSISSVTIGGRRLVILCQPEGAVDTGRRRTSSHKLEHSGPAQTRGYFSPNNQQL